MGGLGRGNWLCVSKCRFDYYSGIYTRPTDREMIAIERQFVTHRVQEAGPHGEESEPVRKQREMGKM